MSLDVYLRLPGEPQPVPARPRILIRRGGQRVEISRAEWDELHPGVEPAVALAEGDRREVFSANITHNLVAMAAAAGLYEPLWQPQESGYTRAGQLVAPLQEGLARLLSDRPGFEQLNPANGWGDYDTLARFSGDYLAACERWPQAEVSVWR